MTCALKVVLGVALGSGVGYAASRLLCAGGGCPITSNRPAMMVLFGLLGAWLGFTGCSSRAPSRPAHSASALTTPAEFQQRVVAAGGPAVVDFHATWCAPCRTLEPVLEELEKQYAGKIAFFRVDVDAARELASQHQIRAVPTLMFYNHGKQVDRIAGAPGREALVQRLDRILAGG